MSDDDEYPPEVAMARFNAALQKALNVTGPRVTPRTVKGYAGTDFMVLDIDFDAIERRGRDLR